MNNLNPELYVDLAEKVQQEAKEAAIALLREKVESHLIDSELRYTIVKCSNNNEYYVNNQWGASENWNKLVITLRNKGFLLIPE